MPINMNTADLAKMAAGVKAVLETAMSQGKTRAFVKTRDFFEAMKFSSLRLVKFSEEMADYMTTYEAHALFGEWVFTEFGDGYSVFVELAKKGEPSGLDAHTDRDDSYFLPVTGRGMTHFNSLQHLIDANAEDSSTLTNRKRKSRRTESGDVIVPVGGLKPKDADVVDEDHDE